jgi:hypothetical protein
VLQMQAERAYDCGLQIQQEVEDMWFWHSGIRILLH